MIFRIDNLVLIVNLMTFLPGKALVIYILESKCLI